MGDKAFYSATTGAAPGRELYLYRPDTNKAELVKDIQDGAADGAPLHIFEHGGTLYFSADDGTKGRELWMNKPSYFMEWTWKKP